MSSAVVAASIIQLHSIRNSRHAVQSQLGAADNSWSPHQRLLYQKFAKENFLVLHQTEKINRTFL